jgi:hypothetical protein
MRRLTSLPLVLALAAAVPACDANPNTGTAADANTIMMGFASLMLVPGQQVESGAICYDSDGALIMSCDLTWTSSNPAAATVVHGVFTGIHAGTTTATARAKSQTVMVTITVTEGGMADPDSGVIYSDDRSFWMTRSAGAFEHPAPFRMVRQPVPTVPGFLPFPAWHTDGGAETANPLWLTMRYDPALLPPGTDQTHLQFRGDSDGSDVGGNLVDTVAHTVTLRPRDVGLSIALKAMPFNVTALSLPAPFMMHPGEFNTIGAATDADASGFGVRWSSSDPTVVSVDVNGSLTAHATGTATITAAMVNLRASTVVTVAQ